MLAFPVESGLKELQRSFAEAIFSHDVPIPESIRAASGNASASRFGVYRNNVVASLTRAIASRYPVCRKLLWPDTFDGAARLYAMTEPPRSPVLLHYGDSFPHFLRRIGKGAATDYVSDIAALETARVRAYHAGDAVSVPNDAFGGLSAAELTDLRVRLHPSVFLLHSRFPVVSAWDAGMRGGGGEDVAWRAESALIVRPQNDVEVWKLPAGGYAFFAMIGAGKTVGEAAAHAAQNDPACELEACFRVMISAGIVVGLSTADQANERLSC